MTDFIKRSVLPELVDHLREKAITLLVGPRQAGKTTLMLLMKDHLEKNGEKTAFFNLDFDEQKIYFNHQVNLINYLNLQFGQNKAFIFIDEVQRLKNAGLFLKGLYDRNLPYKFIVSGSGSLELKEKIHESLAGRKRIFTITPITLLEYVNFKTNYQYEKKVEDFFLYDKILPAQLIKDYLSFGGYPQVVLADIFDKKKVIIQEIFQSYLEKDIQELLGIEKKEAFIKLVSLMASQIGQLINHTELSQTLQIDFQTVKAYLWYLEKTFIVQKITPSYSNVRKELSKMPCYYFTDLGLRNYALNQWLQFPTGGIDGFLFQNFVFLLLQESKKFGKGKFNFWRTKDGAEVDFTITFGLKTIPVEVKDSFLKDIVLSRSFKNYLTKYQPQQAYIINRSLKKEINFGQSKIIALPYYELL